MTMTHKVWIVYLLSKLVVVLVVLNMQPHLLFINSFQIHSINFFRYNFTNHQLFYFLLQNLKSQNKPLLLYILIFLSKLPSELQHD